jgi:hypothetical protein
MEQESSWLSIHIVEIINVFAVLVVGFLAWRIGRRQNKINEISLSITNFVEIFVMPQQVILQDKDTEKKSYYWNLLVKNASSYPIYLNRFTLNGVSHLIGNSVVPVGGDNWYAVPVPGDVQSKGELSLDVEYEDYLGNIYKGKHYGVFGNGNWQIKSEKSVLLPKGT